jgi:uncharacterized protein YgiB involved in biofilm formation
MMSLSDFAVKYVTNASLPRMITRQECEFVYERVDCAMGGIDGRE